jgi:membrane protease YdiL (CAAX protease family)
MLDRLTRRQILWLEVIAILGPPILASIVSLHRTQLRYLWGQSYPLDLNGSLTLILVLQALPAIYIILTSGDSLSRFGVVKFAPYRDLAIAIACLIPIAMVGIAATYLPMSLPNPNFDMAMPFAGLQLALLIVGQAILGEFLYRGYALARLSELLPNRFAAGLVAVVTSSLPYVYAGIGMVVVEMAYSSVLVFGFMVRRSLWGVAIASALANSIFWVMYSGGRG